MAAQYELLLPSLVSLDRLLSAGACKTAYWNWWRGGKPDDTLHLLA